MANRRKPLDPDVLAHAVLAQCDTSENGAVAGVLRLALRANGPVTREVVQRPDVQTALAQCISGITSQLDHAPTSMLLRTLHQVDPAAAAAVLSQCDLGALARSLSYVMQYSAQEVILLGCLYTCNPDVGRRVFHRCGRLLKEFLSRSPFPSIELPEDLIADVECWKEHQ